MSVQILLSSISIITSEVLQIEDIADLKNPQEWSFSQKKQFSPLDEKQKDN